jgi:hypothetical protein
VARTSAGERAAPLVHNVIRLGRRLISSEPQPHRGELDHVEEVGGELVVAGSDAAEVLQLREEALDQVALAVETLAEAGFPAPVALARDVGRGALVLDQLADAIGVVGLIRQHDGSRDEMVEQCVGDLPVMRLACCQCKPDREPSRVDDDVDLGREPAPGATGTMIYTPLFAVAAC